MFRVLVILCFGLFFASPSFAGQSEAREVARLNNCPPKKIEVVQNFPGSGGKTVYKATCNLPKTAGTESAGGADAILIGCTQSLCTLIRPVSAEKN
jgi:hypothetical protein